MIRTAIVDDIFGLSKALKEKVELSPDFEVCWVASNGEEALDCLKRDAELDVILMDIRMPVLDGIATTEIISTQYPHIKVIMSTVFDDEDHLLKAILSGAKGYLLKDAPPRKIHSAIEEVMEGGAPMSPKVAGKALQLIRQAEALPKMSIPEHYQLTRRETEILGELIDGLSYQKIADKLFISYGTVRKHIEHVYRKLEVHGKVEAIRKIANGI